MSTLFLQIVPTSGLKLNSTSSKELKGANLFCFVGTKGINWCLPYYAYLLELMFVSVPKTVISKEICKHICEFRHMNRQGKSFSNSCFLTSEKLIIKASRL